MPDIKSTAKKVESLAQEIKNYQDQKKKFSEAIDALKKNYPNERAHKEKLDAYLKGRTEEEWTAYFDSQINRLLKETEKRTDEITKTLAPPKPAKPSEKKETTTKKFQEPIFYLSKKQEERYKKELMIDKEYLERLRPKKGEGKELLSLKDYSVYEVNPYGRTANMFVEKYTEMLIKSVPEMYDNLTYNLRTSDMKILSKTYVSMMLLTSVVVMFFALLIALLVSFFSAEITIFSIIKTLFLSATISMIAGSATMGAFYYYPTMLANTRRRQIKNDLPFVILHMSAVAGSGAQPIAMFNLIFSSGEYKGLEGEVKKIINYVNLFGYDLSTALRTVALTTPSPEFRELLTGMVTTVETGGSLKNYLTAKADESMVNYRLERKKYIESQGTYADVYTGLLIAAPLLFFVTLAIIQMLGGAIMGISVKTLATIGTFVILPAMNLGFIIFLNITQPE